MNKKVIKRKLRHARGRAKIEGNSKMPRLAVFKSNRYLYAQIIDDEKSATLVSSSNAKNKMTPEEIGIDIATKAKEKKVTAVVFDRGGFPYHGQIKELADGARKGGLKL